MISAAPISTLQAFKPKTCNQSFKMQTLQRTVSSTSTSSTISTPPNSPIEEKFQNPFDLMPTPDELKGRLGLLNNFNDDEEIEELADDWRLPEVIELKQPIKRKEVWTWSFQEKRLKMFEYPVTTKVHAVCKDRA